MASRSPSPAHNANRKPLPEDVLLEVVAHHLMDIVVVTDADVDEPGPRMVYVNDRFSELTGYSPAEVIGRSPRLLQGPDTDPQALKRIRRALQSGLAVTETVANYARDGTRYDLEMRIMPLVDPAGRPTHFVAIERDVTRELARRAQRERMELLLATIVHSLDFGVLVHDENGRCVVANAHLLGLLGASVDKIIGAEVTSLLPGFEWPRTEEAGQSARIEEVRHPQTGQRLVIEPLRQLPGMDRFKVLRINGVEARQQQRDMQDKASEAPPAESVEATGVIAGRMQLVGLQAIRQALGSKWEQRRDKVFELAQNVLKRRLAPRDVWRRSGEDGFILAFAEGDEHVARFRAAAIADEIRQALIGGGETEIACTSVTAKVDLKAPVDIEDDDILAELEQSISGVTVQLETRVKQQLREGMEHQRIAVDDVRLVRRDQVLAYRIRLDEILESDVLAVRNALEEPGDALLDVQSFLLAQSVQILSRQSGDELRPLIVPFDPVLMDSRRVWTRLLDVTRRIIPPLRKRIVPLIDGVRPQDGAYRISDMAVTLSQIFGAAALVHPTSGGLRFIPDRCRLRAVVFRANELPQSTEDKKRFAKLVNDARMARVQIGIDTVSRFAPTNQTLPPHDLLIVPNTNLG